MLNIKAICWKPFPPVVRVGAKHGEPQVARTALAANLSQIMRWAGAKCLQSQKLPFAFAGAGLAYHAHSLCVCALSGRSVGNSGGTGQDLCTSGFYPPMSFYAGDRFQSSIHSSVVGSLSILFLPFADGHLDLCNGFAMDL